MMDLSDLVKAILDQTASMEARSQKLEDATERRHQEMLDYMTRRDSEIARSNLEASHKTTAAYVQESARAEQQIKEMLDQVFSEVRALHEKNLEIQKSNLELTQRLVDRR